MSELITVRGFVGTDVREDKTHSGDAVASFRLGATERRFNRETNTWEDGQTNWFSVVCFRSLAKNVAFSVAKGERIMVTGRLKIRNWSMPDGRAGTTADIEAESVGHDLLLGVTKYKRSSASSADSSTDAGRDGDGLEAEHPGLNLETGELPGEVFDVGGDGLRAADTEQEEGTTGATHTDEADAGENSEVTTGRKSSDKELAA